MSKTVLITGCSSGIGRALADAFKAANFRVWATARKAGDLAALNAAGFNAVQLDVNDSDAVAQLTQRLSEDVGGLDVLVNNAGYGAMGPLLDGGREALQRQFDTNVFALIDITQALFPLLRKNKGVVVNIGSVSGVLVTPFAAAYCASKAAVHALSNGLRMELAPFGVQVLEVQPGAIASSFGANASREAEQLIAQDSPWWPIREGIRARARASQDNPTPAATVAQQILAAVQRPKPPRLLRVGNGGRALPLIAALVPQGLLEWGLKKKFGLAGRL